MFKRKLILIISMVFAWASIIAQNITINGKVTDGTSKEPLPGVSIVEKGSTNGTITDVDGNYSIRVKDQNAILVFSFIGYLTEESPVLANTTINQVMVEDIQAISEVVVIGYGTVKKADATGSIAVVTDKDFNPGSINSAQELIVGKTAGVTISTNSGAPGNTSTIRIRGGSSLNASNDPLIVIDGVPIENSTVGGSPNILATLNPADIETFTILKDASATAIYGARASNGVILITTKRGGKKLSVNYKMTASVYTTPKMMEVFSGDEYRALINEQYAGQSNVIGLLGDANTDWQKEIYQTAFGHDHLLSVSGSIKNTPARLSVGYNNTDGVLKTYNFERSTVNFGIDPSFFDDYLKISVNVKAMQNKNNFADQTAIQNAVAYDPTKPVMNGNSRWRGYTTWTTINSGIDGPSIDLATANPVARLDLTDNTSEVFRAISNAKIDYKVHFLPDLKMTLNLGYDYSESHGHNNVLDSTQWIYVPVKAGGQYNPYQDMRKNELLDYYMTYEKELEAIQSKISVMGGYSWSHFYRHNKDSLMDRAQTTLSRQTDFETEYYNIGFYGRANYDLMDRYLLTFTLRDDATSRFSPDDRWGLFPAAAFAWKIINEDFMKNQSLVSSLKLRLGYGITGQQNIGGTDYPYFAKYTQSDISSRYQLGNEYYYTLRPDGYDAHIKWETTKTTNAGIDFGLYSDRITGSIDYYSRKTSDLIGYVDVAAGTNFSSKVTTNVGSMENKGLEFMLNAKIISTQDLVWEVGYNLSYNKNEITQLNLNKDPDFIVLVGGVQGTTSGTIQVQKIGCSMNSFYVYEQMYDEQGKPIEGQYVDRNKDGQVNSSDLYTYQKPAADVLMGFNTNLSYKNWNFGMSARISLGNYVYNNVASNSTYAGLYSPMNYLSNITRQANDTKFASQQYYSDYYVENGSFLKIDNVNLGYTFTDIASKGLSLNLNLAVQNVLLITGYKGLDPEINGGMDNNFYPRTRAFMLGVSLTF